MGIRIITGQPGNGKTLYMMSLLDAAIQQNNKLLADGKPHRPIYVSGVDGLAPGLATVLDDASDWQSLPDGALIFVDEAWKNFGHLHDARQAPTPKHVLALAEHRHRGMDFVMTTQMANQLYPFMRGLVGGAGGGHTHVARHFGTSLCTIYNWPELNEDTKSPAQRERAVSEKWVQPAKLFSMYKSATLHTVKRSLPWKIALIPLCIFGFIFMLWFSYSHYQRFIAKQSGGDASGAAAATTASTAGHDRVAPKTADEWVKALTPVLPGLPYTAPIFSDAKPVSRPRNFCMISGKDFRDPGSSVCRCMTEQGTRPGGISDALCRTLAMNGYYDPFLQPQTAQVQPLSNGSSDSNRVSSLPGPDRSITPVYVPPGSSARNSVLQ